MKILPDHYLSALVPFRRLRNQKEYFKHDRDYSRIDKRAQRLALALNRTFVESRSIQTFGPRRNIMSGQVILYFDDQADALRFALAAGSVMAGEAGKFSGELVEETTRVSRIRLDAVNAGGGKKPSPGRVA